MISGDILSLKVPKSEVISELQRFVFFLVILISAVIVVSMITVSFIVIKTIVNPIKSTSSMLSTISEGAGDLTQRLSVQTKDEVGALANSFNQFMSFQSSFIDELKISSNSVEGVKDEVVSTAEETSSSINQISTNIDSINNQMETDDASVIDTASSIKKLNKSIGSIDDQISEQSSMVEETSSSINEISATINNAVQITQVKLEAVRQQKKIVDENRNDMESTNESIKDVINQLSAIQNLNDITVRIKDSSVDIKGGVESIVLSENNLQDSSTMAKNGISEIKQGIQQIVESSVDLVESSSSLNDIVNDLQAKARRFKTSD